MNYEEKLQKFDENLRALNTLVSVHNKALRLEFALILQNQDYNDVQEANSRLSRKIDQLRGKLHDEWIENGEDIKREVSLVNRRLQKIINDIKKNIKIAENIVKAVRHIDRVGEIASRFL